MNKITRSPHTSPRHSSSSREEKHHETARKSSKEGSSAYYDTRHSRSERGSGGQQRLSEARPQSHHKEERYTDNNHLQPSRRAEKPHSQEVYDNRHKEGRRSSGRSEESTTATARNQRGSSQNRSQSKAEDGSGRRSDRNRESASTRHYRESTVSPQLRSSSEREVKFNLENHKTESRHYKQENNQPSEHSKRSTKSNLKSRSAATAELRDKDPRSSSEREVRFSTEKPRRKEREHSKEYLLKSRTENRANNSNNRSSQSSSTADHSSGGRSSSERELKNLGGRSSSSDEHECCSASDCGALSCTSDCRQSSEESSPFNKYEPKHGAMIVPLPPLPPALPGRYSSSHSKTPSPISSTTSHMSNSIKETSPKPPIEGDLHPAAADDGSRKKVLIRSRSHDSIVEAEEDERRAQRRKADAEARKSRSAEECQPFYLHSPTHSGHQVPPPRNEYTTIQSLFYEIPERPMRYEGRKLMGQQPYVLESGGHKRRAAPPIPLPQGLFEMDILC